MTTAPNTTASGAADLMRNALRETAAVLVLEDAFPDLLQMVKSALAASAPVAPTQPATPASAAQPPVVSAPVKIVRDFRWDSDRQHHVPTLLLEFEPVPANSPIDAKGWNDRDDVAIMLAAPKADHIPEAGKMLGDLLARIHGDGGHYASEHGIEKAVADADRILAEWRAYKPAPLQQGEYLPLPEGWPARFRCDSCEGNGEVGEPIYQGYFQPPEKARCPECSGVGWSSEEQAYNTDQVHAAIDADRAARGAAQPAQEARLNPDMPTQELRLHMGELTTDEALVARLRATA